MFRSFILFALIACAVPLLAAPQQFKLVVVHAAGSNHFSEDDIIRHTGLRVGGNVTQDQLQEVANKLAASGVFSEVNYNFKPLGTGVSVEFEVKDGDLLPARFENFVWFSDDELRAALHESVPLFSGQVSLSGEVATQITDSLTHLLAAKGVNATVAQRFHSKAAGAQPDAVVYLAEGLPIPITKVEFPGAAHLPKPEADKITQLITSNNYEYGLIAETSVMELARRYSRMGYLQASVQRPVVKSSVTDPMKPSVEVAIPIIENEQYSMAEVIWRGNESFPADELRKRFKMRNGEIADMSKIEEGLASVMDLYGTKGFMQMQVKKNPVFDAAAKSVAFTFDINEGDQFRMGKLEIHGLAPELITKLTGKWKLQPGQTFDTSYVKQFLKDTVGMLPPQKASSSVQITQKANKDKTIDLGVTY